MVRHIGSPASGGLAVGKIKVINRRIRGFKRVVLATHREKALYEAAVILAKDEIHRLMQSDDGENKDILNFQLVMLDDNGLNQMILSNIESGMAAPGQLRPPWKNTVQGLKKSVTAIFHGAPATFEMYSAELWTFWTVAAGSDLFSRSRQ